jgi:D-beta-D-heptose 7-phosphate kinase/D-beta-D-heptose 1-phosphate adenosyltransferase
VARSLASALETNVVLTLGARGIRFCNQAATEEFALRTTAREVFDVSGAGDTVAAAFALSLAAGADHATAVAIANRAAGVAVAKFGTATVTAEEILQQSDALRLVPRHALADLATTLRVKGKRLVAITGSFDILRSAHLRMLNEARHKGDVLIVGLSGDARERALAGFERPVVSERQRADMLLALRVVDYVHIFDELDPSTFLMAINPDVHVSAFDDSVALTERAAAT